MIRGDKLIVLYLGIFLLLSVFVYAQGGVLDTEDGLGASLSDISAGFDAGISYSWLHDKLVNMTAPADVRSLATIALIQRGAGGSFGGLVEEIYDLEDQEQHCWPSTGCKIEDTALATLALALAGQDVNEQVEWLKSAKISGLPPGGEWSIAIKSDSDGTCEFTFSGIDVMRTFSLEDDRVRLPTGAYTQQQYYIRLNELHPTLATGTVQPEINVNCEVVNPIITLLYKPNVNTFFIQRSDAGPSQQFKVANACYGNTRGTGPCNYKSTAIATWALQEIGTITGDSGLSLEDIGTHIYLETQIINRRNDAIDLGLLNRILIQASNAAPSFINDLVSLQRISDGSWENSVVATSIAVFGLTGTQEGDAVIRGSDFIRETVDDEGGWNNNLEDTAWALIALHGGDLSIISVPVLDAGEGGLEVCGNAFDDDGDGIYDCGEIECASDPLCQCQNGVQDGDEEGIDCGGSCSGSCASTDEPECTIDADCFSGEVCVSGQCIFGSSNTEVEEDSAENISGEEKERSLAWIWIIIIILLLVGLGLFYVKYVKTGKVKFKDIFKKKPKGPTFEQFKMESQFKPAQRPLRKPIMPANNPPFKGPSVKSKVDVELDKSMREAQRILRDK